MTFHTIPLPLWNCWRLGISVPLSCGRAPGKDMAWEVASIWKFANKTPKLQWSRITVIRRSPKCNETRANSSQEAPFLICVVRIRDICQPGGITARANQQCGALSHLPSGPPGLIGHPWQLCVHMMPNRTAKKMCFKTLDDATARVHPLRTLRNEEPFHVQVDLFRDGESTSTLQNPTT